MTAEPVSMRGGSGGDVCCGMYVPLSSCYIRKLIEETAAPDLPASNVSNAAAKHETGIMDDGLEIYPGNANP